MSWSLLLSRYPKSLLKTELPSLLLAWVERNGVVNEDDLKLSLGLSLQELSSALFELYTDGLLRYLSDGVTVSEQGRVFLEKLDIDQAVVEDSLENIGLSKDEFSTYSQVVRVYRKEAFSSYLRTMDSIKTWDLACSNFDDALSLKRKGRVALLIKSLRNWQINRTVGEFPSGDLSPWLSEVCTSRNLQASPIWYFPSTDIEEGWETSASALSWLKSCRSFDIGLAADVVEGLLEPQQKIFFYTDLLQSSQSQDLLRKEIKSHFSLISFRSKKASDNLRQAFDNLSQLVTKTGLKLSDDSLSERLKISSACPEPSSSRDFLLALMSSDSLLSFSESINVDKLVACELLEQVQSRCSLFLDNVENVD